MATPAHIECDLQFVIAQSGIAVQLAARRLKGIENTVTMLARRWRGDTPLAPATELRMFDSTRQQVLAWVAPNLRQAEALTAWLAPYISGAVCDLSVPARWIRLCLKGASVATDRKPWSQTSIPRTEARRCLVREGALPNV